MHFLRSKITWIYRAKDSSSATIQTLLLRIIGIVVSILTGVITARYLGPIGRGEFAAINLWPGFLSGIATFGIPSALVYCFKRYPEDEQSLLSTSLIISSGIGLLVMIGGAIGIPFWMSNYSPATISAAQAFMLMAPLSLISFNFVAALEATNKFSIANHSRYLPQLFILLALVLLVMTKCLNPLTSSLAYAFPVIPMMAFMGFRLRRKIQFKRERFWLDSRHLLGYGVRSYGIDLLGAMSLQISSALVVGLLSPAEMGFYAIALNISRLFGTLQGSVISVLLPRIAARTTQEVISVVGRATRLSMLILILVVSLVFAFCPFIIQTLYGRGFDQVTSVLRLLLIEVVIACAVWLLTQAFMALDKPGVVTLF
jgi:enterobacterial common antigen flippase